ncbi:hypothetical protein QCA50_003379 [Cerrena zonata]|uniref:TLC domain-containing protein n=1 Tax=Cerrena zonata TaxID=2478898 RepID=A0AAW0GUU3_9APHY
MTTLRAQSDAFFRELSVPIAQKTGLTYLPEYAPTIAYATAGYTILHLIIAPAFSKAVFPETYRSLRGRKGRNNWNIRIVSFVNAIVLSWLAYLCLGRSELSNDKAFGWHPSIGTANAVAVGHFIWDSLDSIINFSDVGFVIHGLSCMLLYSLTFRPYLGFYSPRFLLWELSTPFLNIHWCLDKLGKTGSTLQYINGIILLSTFFSVRICYGWYMSYGFMHTLWEVKDQVPKVFTYTLFAGNIILNSLNLFWFSKMISTIRKRFQADVLEKSDKPTANGKIDGKAN